ncbi:Imm39 family immunity protein [Pleionea litopenaei]|uniref:Imm39 family immunity protein n=1 Tax=Pleionea litopenaei TaxID=3070815 RepID=A0AA51RTU5_9GAMM|nr:Imm39 family immunity protein [Pleionea sp. HL-JVS1]WMS87511.1 Imm39 family immunity protein [Pleionea sp. HL-JVS1]
MAHNKKLVLGGVSLTKERPNRFAMQVMKEIRDELELLIINSGFLIGAPFIWIGLILRYGLVSADKPKYQKINKKHGDLPVSIELDTNELSGANKSKLKRIMKKATLVALIDIANKYELKAEEFKKLLDELEEISSHNG